MSLLSSLVAGAAGLDSASTDLSVISDNIANSSTVGYKSERATFEDELAQNIVGGTGQVGVGSQLGGVERIMTQGALQSTGVDTDLALQGDGFFEVAGTNTDGRQGTFLTRAGQFTVDNNGFLVNPEGLRLQGYTADATGKVTTSVGDLQVGNASSAPNATSTVTLKGNLSSSAPVVAPATDANDAQTNAALSTSVSVYDSLGNEIQLQLDFRRTASSPSTWEYDAVADGGAVQGGTAGTPQIVASGTMAFDTAGRLTSVTPNSGLSFTPNGAQPMSLTFDFGDPTSVAGGTGLAGLTQFGGASATTFVGQDGYASGTLTSVQIDQSGRVNGVFTNGQTRALAQVGVARVAAPDALDRTGGNLYAVTPQSGAAVLGTAGDGGRASITAGSLEQSNVDIAGQFVDMIAAQRAFEANSKTITTADQLLSELIAMKR